MAALIRTSPRILSSLVQGRTVLPSLVRAFADCKSPMLLLI